MNNSRQGIQVGWTRAAFAARAGDRCLSVVALLLIVSLLLFGGRKIPELMKGLGKGVKSFKDGVNGVEEPEIKEDKAKDAKE